MAQVEFSYEQINEIIECDPNEKMKDIFQKFATKSEIDINSVYFLYEGNKLDEELTFEQIKEMKEIKISKINISVHKREKSDINENKTIINSNKIICPECGEISIINIKDYRINMYGCKNGHKTNDILLDKFESMQTIDISKILCDKCRENNKSNTNGNTFFRCNECRMNLCEKCKIEHDTNHKIIDYDDKDYICNKHNELFTEYCNDCKLNLCSLCGSEHVTHKIISIMTDLNKSKNKMKHLKRKINNFENNINNLIEKLKKVMENIDIYYNILNNLFNNIINNFENNKKINYELYQNINEINNNDLFNDINEINKDFNNKINNIIKIYNKMINNEFNEINIIYNIDDISKNSGM